MTKKNIVVLLSFFLFMGISSAQVKDTTDPYYYRNLSPEQALKIFGPVKGIKINKLTGEKSEIKDITIKGNKITTLLFNYGSVCTPNALSNVEDLVWNNLGYGFEFGLIAGAEVVDGNGDTLHIISDSHVRSSEGDYSPGASLKWGWLPRHGYSDNNQDKVASLRAEDKNGDGKPDSWPEEWYSPGAGKYLWPAFLGDMATAPDEEVFYAIDDYTNYEFIDRYQPFPSDPTKAGLGLEATVRILQFNNPMAEDIIFMVYQITNASEKDLDKVYVGMFGDPHVGGATDYIDDRSFFIPPAGPLADAYDQRARSMVYSWDADFKGMGGKVPGYFGWKFLESPSFANNSKDDDDDGIMDESPFNGKGIYIDGVATPLTTGIYDLAKYTKVYGAPKPRWSGDEDGDWDPEKHDVGIDGIGPESANYPGPDYGEGDGVPSQAFYQDLNNNGIFDNDEKGTLSDIQLPGYKWAGSEPNFGYRDISESDMLGLTGFTAARYGAPNIPKEDELIWQWMNKPEIDPEQELLKTEGDNIFCFSTGAMSLKKGETQRFSMAIIMGENKDDLILNAITSVRILEADYRFAQPPAKPIVKAVSEDGRVHLYWDAKSEDSVDPLTQDKDFEGYKIYRSRNFNFSDVYTITDANGVPFLGQALQDVNTGKKAQWDLVDTYSGLAQREYDGRGVKYYLGDNSGLKHEYVDSTVQNGITYYYAVVAYDHGSPDLPPTETQSVIQQDPLTGKLIFDVNTVQVTPGPVSKGMVSPEIGINGAPTPDAKTDATGTLTIKVMEQLAVVNKMYHIHFDDALTYSVLDSTGVKATFKSKDTVLVTLPNKEISEGSLQIFDQSDNLIDTSKYIVNYHSGQVAGRTAGDFVAGNMYKASYRYFPVYKSKLLNSEDANPTFDGLRLFVQNDILNFDLENSRFLHNADVTIHDTIFYPALIGVASLRTKISADWEIRWNSTDTLADGSWAFADSITAINGKFKMPFKIYNVTADAPAPFVVDEFVQKTKNNKRWDWGEGIVLQPQGATNAATSYEVVLSIDTTSTVRKLPKAGDVYLIKTRKPFEKDDSYIFETKKAEVNNQLVQQSINDIYVVPNPYVAYSMSENPGRTFTKRGERELQFRNLPQRCTIRIYTITGELVDTIEKDDYTSMASWNLLSSEGMRIAYGVYIYHVDIPGAGEKIGKFGVIK